MSQIAVNTDILANHAEKLKKYKGVIDRQCDSLQKTANLLREHTSFTLVYTNLRALIQKTQMLGNDFLEMGNGLASIIEVYNTAQKDNMGVVNDLDTDVSASSAARTSTPVDLSTLTYEEIIEYRVQNAVEESSARLYEKFADKIRIKDDSYDDTAYYHPFWNHIKLDAESDRTDVRGPGSVYFHEVGHLIDDQSDWFGSSSEDGKYDFYDKLESDFDNYVKSVMDAKGYTDVQDAYRDISAWLQTDPHMKSGVSDIVCGLTDGKCSGLWAHSLDYYNEKSISNEAFAHFFESGMSDDPVKMEYVKTIFPNAYDEYLRIVEDILD